MLIGVYYQVAKYAPNSHPLVAIISSSQSMLPGQSQLVAPLNSHAYGTFLVPLVLLVLLSFLGGRYSLMIRAVGVLHGSRTSGESPRRRPITTDING